MTEKRRLLRLDDVDLTLIKYVPREIHAVKGTSSHSTMAHMASVIEQEKFRSDPRFPLFQLTQRRKRLRAIINGAPYGPIFA